MDLYYLSSQGEKIALMTFPIAVQDPEKLIDTSWKYTKRASAAARGVIKNLYRDTVEHTVRASIFADSREEFAEVMERMHRCFEEDARSLVPGKLFWNDYYRECFATMTSYTEYVEDFDSIEEDITFLSPYPYWIKESSYEFRADLEQSGRVNLDFPYDYPLDYGDAMIMTNVQNEAMFESDFELKIYGPCTNPILIINGNTYKVTCTLQASEQLIIDSAKREIYSVTKFGVKQNQFANRYRDSYIFQKINNGGINIEWSRDFDFDLKLYQERNVPPWN